jgi:hypothetical protein
MKFIFYKKKFQIYVNLSYVSTSIGHVWLENKYLYSSFKDPNINNLWRYKEK